MLAAELGRADSFREQLQQSQPEQQHTQPALQDSLQAVSHEGLQGEACHPYLDRIDYSLEDVDEVFGDASEVAARLPGALPVSSLTQQGIEQLQAAIIDMFSKQAARAARAAIAAAENGGSGQPAILAEVV